MKPAVSTDTRRQVLELRRRHSLRAVAEQTGLPLGTVKTICSRSGAFRDNVAHRALFSLPPMRHTSQTLPAVPELPPQQRVTGDKEVDAVLWLRQVIGTGQAALIEKAMQGAKKIKTPLDQLEKRYTQILASANPGNPFATLASFCIAVLVVSWRDAILMLRKRSPPRVWPGKRPRYARSEIAAAPVLVGTAPTAIQQRKHRTPLIWSG